MSEPGHPFEHAADRWLASGEIAQLLGVTEREVDEWIERGYVPVSTGSDGVPRMRITEAHSESSSGAASMSSTFRSYRHEVPAELLAAAQEREHRLRRAREIDEMHLGGVDLDALTDGLARRLTAAAPPGFAVRVAWRGMLDLLDVAAAVSSDPSVPAAERVRATALSALDALQVHLAEETTEPWPGSGGGQLAQPHAELDDRHVRMFFGSPDDPALTLEPLPLDEVLLGG